MNARKEVQLIAGVEYIVEYKEFMNRHTGERKLLPVVGEPVNPDDANLAMVQNHRIKQHDDRAPKLYPYIPEGVDTRIWTLTPEDAREAEIAGKMAADKEIMEMHANERKHLRETWGDFVKQKGLTMHDLFPSIFYEGE